MIGDSDRLEALRERLDQTAQVFEAAEHAGHEGEASDPSGSVWVTIGPDGTLRSLVVRESWSEHCTPDALGALVRDTYAAAQLARNAAMADDVATRLHQPLPAPRAPEPATGSTAEHLRRSVAAQAPGAVSAAAFTTRLSEFLAEALAVLDDGARRAEELRRAVHAGTVASAVVARVDGVGQLVAVEYDERWLAQASAFTIGLRTVEAITNARAAGAAAAQDPFAGSALADLARTVDDPALLAQRLGLGA